MKKSRSNHAADCAKRARENAFLVGEIEALKRELKAVRGYKMPRRLTREGDMYTVRFNGVTGVTYWMARIRIYQSCYSYKFHKS